jgi:hypothetical protein
MRDVLHAAAIAVAHLIHVRFVLPSERVANRDENRERQRKGSRCRNGLHNGGVYSWPGSLLALLTAAAAAAAARASERPKLLETIVITPRKDTLIYSVTRQTQNA